MINDMLEQIILVDKEDNPMGFCEKMKAHKEGKLHRAFSIFIFNSEKDLLIQQRAKLKYHSGGLWSNTCCSHHRFGETLDEAIHRRLKEEMGFDCELKEIFSFIYKTEFKDINLFEHELDHVYIGNYNGEIVVNFLEVEDYKWISKNALLKDIDLNSEKYTYWFKITINRVLGLL